jgi:hypothetical protein
MGLSGQMLMMSDDMPALTPDRVELLKRIIPVANLRPVNLYPMARADMMDARIQRPWGSWDVVGLFNFGRRAASRTLDLARLGLDASGGARYLVYDFWNRALVGLTHDTLTLDVPAEGCRVLSVRRYEPRPQLISTSRHITQGGVELRDLKWDAKTLTLSGASDLIAGDPYTLTVSLPAGGVRYRLRRVDVDRGVGEASVSAHGTTATATFASAVSRPVHWQMTFAQTRNGSAAPGAPQGVQAIYALHREVELTWTAVPTAVTYTICRDGKPVGTTGGNRFEDTALSPFGEHTYQVAAQGWAGETAKSRVVRVRLPRPMTLYLSELTPVSEHQGWGTLSMDRSVDGHPLSIGGVKFAHGLGTHSTTGGVGEQVYDLGGQFARFTAMVGIDDETEKRGSGVFQVWVDGVKRYDSGVMRGGDPAQAVAVDVKGAKTLRLVVTDAGDGFEFDHADWADARLQVRPQ